MDEKKSFFDLLDPKSALFVGLLGGLLSLGTIGFVILGVYNLRNGVSSSALVATTPVVAQVAPSVATAPTEDNTPTPTVTKTARPKVELFVMSYCPYGLQTQKGMIPAWELLKNKADINVKFVSYAMHGEKEVLENTRQYCIEKQGQDKYLGYLKCFAAAGDSAGCLTSAGINQASLNSCTKSTDNQFGITKLFNDQTKWLSGRYPVYPIHEALNTKYGVQGSPTLVINGQAVDAGRSPDALKKVICAAFTNPPAECNQELSKYSYVPSFGMDTGGSAPAANQPGCGT